MGVAFVVWSVVLLLVALIWASRHAAVNRAQRGEKPLSSAAYPQGPDPAPRVSLLVAAKDEEDNIESCVTSLLSQDYPNLEVIAVNDRSRDRTPEILRGIKPQNGVVFRTLHISQLREGWFGKNNAMREGVEHATGEWLCFTDADCRQVSNRTVSMAMRYALDKRIDFLSVLPVLETHSFWERVLQPVCAAIMVMWFRPEKVNDPASPSAYANGAFMLLKRDLYDAIGGHERIKTEVNEDMHMARLTKELGRRLYVIPNDDLYRTRMYASFRECWRGWSRIFYGCFGTFRRLVITAAVLLVSSIFPWLSLFAGLIGAFTAQPRAPWLWITLLSAVAVVIQQTWLIRFYRLTKADPRYVPTYILGAVVAFGMVINAMTKLGGLAATTWRGTTYRGSRLSSPGDRVAR